jgi:predicted outer membrane lipoprotein
VTRPSPSRRTLAWTLGWLLAAAFSVAVGAVVVTQLGASNRDRGPIGDNELIRQAELTEGSATPDPDAEVVRRSIDEEFGSFVVECRGIYAYGVEVVPDRAAGWRVVSFERGPDDDVDAVFAQARRSIDIEVFCNRGEPTVAELERNELSEDD